MIKSLSVKLFVLISMLCMNVLAETSTISEIKSICQAKNKWISLKFQEEHSKEMDELVRELLSYEEKISSVTYIKETGILNIYYTDLISLDDILQIVLKHFSDFEKVGGSEL